MSDAIPMQLIGNVCISLAALIYLVPIQHLLLELARKRADGGGAIAGLVVVAAMWLLLLIGLIATTAQGGMDVLSTRRGLLYVLVVISTLALAAVTFMSLVSLSRPTWTERLTVGLPIYLVPPLTIAFIAVALNPGLAARIPIGALRVPWMAVAGLSLAGCTGYLGITVVRRVSGAWIQVAHAARQDPVIEEQLLATVPTLDPRIDFDSLLGHAAHGGSPELRRLATERLRTHPDLIGRLIESLAQTEPNASITFIAGANLSDEERDRLARPLHRSMEDLADYIHDRLRYFPGDWKSRQRAWGRRIYPAVARRFAGTGPDFASLPDEFDDAFTSGRR